MATLTEPQFNLALEPERLTDKDQTKTVPCRRCRRRCVVTVFATEAKTECSTCRGKGERAHKEKVKIAAAHTVDPAQLDNLSDALINPAFKRVPYCPFDPEHEVELKSVTHSPNYGPRHLKGYDGRGYPQYDQQTGETITYQCNTCRTTISFSTMHQIVLKAQNEARQIVRQAGDHGSFAATLGTREEPEPEPTLDPDID